MKLLAMRKTSGKPRQRAPMPCTWPSSFQRFGMITANSLLAVICYL